MEGANFSEVNNILTLKTINTRTCKIIKKIFRDILNRYCMYESRTVTSEFDSYLARYDSIIDKTGGSYELYMTIKASIKSCYIVKHIIHYVASDPLETISLCYIYDHKFYMCVLTHTNGGMCMTIEDRVYCTHNLSINYNLLSTFIQYAHNLELSYDKYVLRFQLLYKK